jgi:SAM-dependent methyltransferase
VGVSPPDEVARDSIGWDVSNWSTCFTYWSEHTRLCLPGARALEIGAQRGGGLSLWMATQGMDVTCSGIKMHTEEMAAVHARHGVSDRVTFESIDALDIPYRDEFDVVAFKSVLGNIGQRDRVDLQRKAVAQMHGALRPGGELWFAENLAATRLHAALRTRFGAGIRDWRYVKLAELDGLFCEFIQFHYTTVGFLAPLGHREWQRRLLGTVDRAVMTLVPPACRYIALGIATK